MKQIIRFILSPIKCLILKPIKWLIKDWPYVLIIASIILLLFIYHSSIFDRLLISVKILGHNIAYYFIDFYVDDAKPPLQTYDIILANNGGNLLFLLPVDFNIFIERLKLTLTTLINPDVLNYYLVDCKNLIAILARWIFLLITLIFPVLALVKATRRYKENSKIVETKPLKFWKRLAKTFYDPLRAIFIKIWQFLVKSTFFKVMIVLLILIISSAMVIFVDLLATYFYLVTSFDFNSVWQFTIIALTDFLPVYLMLPLIVQCLIVYYFIDVIRLFFGVKRLEADQKRNEDYLDTTGNLVLINGASGTGKTDIQQDMIQTEENKLRNKKLLGIIHDVQNKFAFFPWGKIEDVVRRNKESGILKTRYDIYKLSFEIRENYQKEKELFDYNFNKYGLNVYDELIDESLFNAICDYMTAFFFYITPTALSVGNFAISHTLGLNLRKKTYFELFHPDFFNSGKKDCVDRSMNKIINYDFLRLGEKMKSYTPETFYVADIGIYGITEGGKELGSHEQKKADQGKDDDTDNGKVNRSNGLFTERFLIWRHAAELRHTVLFKCFLDEQQLMALNPGMRKAAETVITLDRDQIKHKRALKLWFIEAMICEFIIDKYNKYHDNTKSMKRELTLRSHLAKHFINRIYLYYIRRCNRFDYKVYTFSSVNGSLEDAAQKRNTNKWYLSIKKAHSGRYTSTYLNTLFMEEMKQSRVSFDDLTSYKKIKPTVGELISQHSLFYKEITARFNSSNLKKKKPVKETKKGSDENETKK